MPGRAASSSRSDLFRPLIFRSTADRPVDRPGGSLPRGELGQLLHNIVEHGAHGSHFLAAPALADGIDLLLRCRQQVAGGAHALLHHGGDVPRRLGHGAQQGLIPDDTRVLHHIGGGRASPP